MPLTLDDYQNIVKGFKKSGYEMEQTPTVMANPLLISVTNGNQQTNYRLWAFQITPGGGGASVRAADEFRVQVTNGPKNINDFDSNGYIDLLIGYSREKDTIAAYDRRWLEAWTRHEETRKQGEKKKSPSAQVKDADIQKGKSIGFHHLTKSTKLFNNGNIVTMTPEKLPEYLRNHNKIIKGEIPSSKIDSRVTTAKNIVDYCHEQGLPFKAELIARYIASILTKPFVILAGVSGTGKSKLAQLVAEFYGVEKLEVETSETNNSVVDGKMFGFSKPFARVFDSNRFSLVAVRPDWIDNQSILGFVNPLTGKYESTQALDIILRASENIDQIENKLAANRYFMLLDEMNIARVEHYFSDWLSCSESRRLLPDGSISQQAVPLHRNKELTTSLINHDGTTSEKNVPSEITLPTNLIVTGTVNVDETTFGFSPKVLDRAMVIEFDEVDLEGMYANSDTAACDNFSFPEHLPDFKLASSAHYKNLQAPTHAHLVNVNQILEQSRLHFGYRTANEIALFIEIYNTMLPKDDADIEMLRALDVAILQKVLPRLSGNRVKLEKPLTALCFYLKDLTMAVDKIDTTSMPFEQNYKAKMIKSYVRALEMLDALRTFGYVSFFK
jgi:hypothetical protein